MSPFITCFLVIFSKESLRFFLSIGLLHEHVAWPDSPDEAIAMNELKEIRVFKRNDDNYMLKIISRLSPVDTLTLEEYRYGGFVMRATDYWTRYNSDFFTSEGLDRDHADGERARWFVVQGNTLNAYGMIIQIHL